MGEFMFHKHMYFFNASEHDLEVSIAKVYQGKTFVMENSYFHYNIILQN